jgi:hypothetical protein
MYIKKCVQLFSIFIVSLSMISGVTTNAASEFLSGNTISANKNYENLYVNGATVTADGTVQKDLIGAGGTISTTGQINRNAIIAGGTVTVKSQIATDLFIAGGTVIVDTPGVGGSTRVAGGTVNLTGNFNEDVLVAGGDVVLRNANVAGDVYVSAGTLTVLNSSIKGKIQGQYGEIKGDDLKKQVVGSVDLTKVETEKTEKVAANTTRYFNFSWELSVIIATLTVGWFLGKRNRLAIPSIRWGQKFGLDILIGLGVLILPGIAMILLLILQLFPIAFLLPALVFLAIIASLLVLPIYVGNFIRNTWNMSLAPKWMTVIGYLVLLAVSLLSSVNYLGFLGVFSFIFVLAHVGFLTRTMWHAANQYTSKRKITKQVE